MGPSFDRHGRRDAGAFRVLGRRPEPQERPRWNTLLEYTEAVWDQPVKGLFFLAVAGELPASFVQALLARTRD